LQQHRTLEQNAGVLCPEQGELGKTVLKTSNVHVAGDHREMVMLRLGLPPVPSCAEICRESSR